jgi:hypothetical protein
MFPDTNVLRESSDSRPPRRLHVLILRLGILGAFLAALGTAAVGFVLFGCACSDSQTTNSNPAHRPEGMIVNPPDPPMRNSTK